MPLGARLSRRIVTFSFFLRIQQSSMNATHLCLVILLVVLAACGGSGGGGASAPASSATVVDVEVLIDNRPAALAVAPLVNRRVLGSNLQWTDGGDGLLVAGSTTFAAAPLAAATTLAPTVLRFPGGTHADHFDWAAGEGAVRGTAMHAFTRELQTVWFGTGEFLDLCQRTGAEPLITLNTLTAAPAESAAWVARCNGGGVLVVRDWEVGNEPYLENSSAPQDDVTAAQFTAAYNAHAAAVLAADPRVRVGLPVIGPNTTRFVPAARQSWNAEVFAGLSQRVDFVAVHDAYLPYYYQAEVPTDAQMLQGILASAPAVAADLDLLRSQLDAAGIAAPFAITEYNAVITLGGGLAPISRSDGTTASHAGSVYLADLLCLLASRDDVDSAQHWSLIGNWLFGAMHHDGAPRPAYRALQGVDEALFGYRLPSVVSGPSADVPAFGARPALTAMPLVAALATASAGAIRTVLVNRSPDRAMRVRLTCLDGATTGAVATVRTLNAGDPLAEHWTGVGTPDWTTATQSAEARGLVIDLPAHSLVIVNLPAPAPLRAGG